MLLAMYVHLAIPGLFFHVCFGLTQFAGLMLVGLLWEDLLGDDCPWMRGELGGKRMKQCPGGGKCHGVSLAKAHSLWLPQGRCVPLRKKSKQFRFN